MARVIGGCQRFRGTVSYFRNFVKPNGCVRLVKFLLDVTVLINMIIAIWFNKICKIEHLTPNYITVSVYKVEGLLMWTQQLCSECLCLPNCTAGLALAISARSAE
jgi:hypothetical protein